MNDDLTRCDDCGQPQARRIHYSEAHPNYHRYFNADEDEMNDSGRSNSTEADEYLSLPYPRVLIPAEEGGFTARILEFPGCISEGETPNEAVENLIVAARNWIEAALEMGQGIPPPMTRWWRQNAVETSYGTFAEEK